MTSTARTDPDAVASDLTAMQRFLTLATVVLASSLYGTALLTTSTILPQMQGAMSATQDEIAWVMTFNILATAIVTPMTGWLVARFGEKRVMVWSIGVFTLATLLCSMSQSLETLVFWRVIQGGTGAPVVPLSQTILLNTFPRRQHTMVLGLFGMAVAVAPVFGPILGGYLAEAYSWRWAFYMLVPVGVAALIGMQLTLRPDGAPRRSGSTGPVSSRCRSALAPSSSCWRAACGSTGSIRPRSWWSAWSRRSRSTSSCSTPSPPRRRSST